MDTPHPPQTIIIECATNIKPHLTPEQNELLRELYSKRSSRRLDSNELKNGTIEKIMIKAELGGGFSGARVLVIIPTDYNETSQPERVVKIGSKFMLEAEYDNYNNFVEDFLPTGVAIQKRFTTYGPIAAIEYVFVGGKRLDPVDDLIGYYEKYSYDKIIKTINNLIGNLRDCWYVHAKPKQEFMRYQYGAHLPEHITLEIRPTSPDLLWSENIDTPKRANGYNLLNENTFLYEQYPVKQTELVMIKDLRVVRIKPSAVTLEHKHESWAQVRVEYAENSGIAEKLQIGQSVNVRGVVITTRHDLLKIIVETAFRDNSETKASAEDDEVLIGLGQKPYPNPLKQYRTILEQVFEGNRSVIHGDLHPRNMLIDKYDLSWLIDFGRVRKGHTLFEFIKLEAYLRLDILSRKSSFSLKEYANFEEALANATLYGIANVNPPIKPDLLKAFRVILAIRQLAVPFYVIGGDYTNQVTTYFRCLMLYNLSLLKYSRKMVLGERGHVKEKQQNLQAARLSFITASVQCAWIVEKKNLPARPRLSLWGILELARLKKNTGISFK